MNKTKLNMVYYVFNIVLLCFLFNLSNLNNSDNLSWIALLFITNIHLLYLEFFKIKHSMKFKKNNSSEIFLYSFYFLSVISLLSGIYFNIFIFIRLGFSLYLFGVIFANKGTIYYDEKILILGFFKINIDNISDVEIKNRKVIIKYNNGLERKMWFFFKSNAKNLFNFLKNSELA